MSPAAEPAADAAAPALAAVTPPGLAGLGPLSAWRSGTVATFDDARGLGTLVGDDATSVAFHCVAIADGSRTIAVGTRVDYRLALGPTGALEGRGITARG